MSNVRLGSLEVVCGSMFSGKTEELMRRLRRAEYAKQQVLTVKHQIDVRKSESCIVSHDGEMREAHSVEGCQDSLTRLARMADEKVNVIGIDEVQFFGPEIIDVILRLVDRGKRVVVAGLDLDFRREPFGPMPVLMALADEVTKLRAICMSCGSEANFTQRLIDGKPARYSDPVVLVGAEECYEARCRQCYEMTPCAHAAASEMEKYVCSN